jgi:hypothetical protein
MYIAIASNIAQKTPTATATAILSFKKIQTKPAIVAV